MRTHELLQLLIYPFEWLVSWILFGWHELFTTLGIPPPPACAWALSIVGLVVVMRAAMIPLFVRQIHASRRMQLIQPEMQKIQAKYKGKSDPDSRQAMTQETMDLYKRTGTNPFSSCLPILLQSPFFFGLFRVLNSLQKIATGKIDPIGPITREVAAQAEPSTFFGAQLSDKFIGAETLTVKIVTLVLIILMSASTFTTQRQLMMKNMPASALDNPFAKQQKMLLYLMPLFFAISGVNFPIGVLIYWLDDQRLVDVPAVLRDPPDAGAGLPGREGACRSGAPSAASRWRSSPSRAWTGPSGVTSQDAPKADRPAPAALSGTRRSEGRRPPRQEAGAAALAPSSDTKPQTDN